MKDERLTESQEEHLKAIKDRFGTFLDPKFRKGAAEHGGDLRDMTPLMLLHNIKEECVDLWVYLDVLEQKMLNENIN